MLKFALLLGVLFNRGWAEDGNTYEFLTLKDVQRVKKILASWAIDNLEINENCKRDLVEYYNGLQDGEPWAIAMFDSFEKFPSGILKGRKVIIGQFGECIDVVHSNFTGQHCMVEAAMKENATSSHSTLLWIERGLERIKSNQFSYGICVPSTCDSKDLKTAFRALGISKYIDVEVNETSCTTGQFPKLRTEDYATITFLSTLILLAVLSTAYDVQNKLIKKNEGENKILTSFSLYSNWKKLFRIDESSSQLNALNGMRFLAMAWVVLGHFYSSLYKGNVINFIDVVLLAQSNESILGTNGYLSVDTFFFLSGLLACFVFFRDVANKRSYDAPVALIHRYLRLTPPFAIVLLLHLTLFSRMGNGPVWVMEARSVEEQCRNDWWARLLYVNNYITPVTKCMEQTWYLAADMQMHFVSPLILYFIFLRPKQAQVTLFILIIGSSLLSFIMSYENDLPPNATVRDFYKNADAESSEYYEFQTRMAPWFIGIATGSIICGIRAKKINFNLKKAWIVVGWSLSAVLCLASLYGIAAFFPIGSKHSTLKKSSYRAFHRGGWALGLAWIVVACVTGNGGFVNDFLSSRIFQPLARLSYSIFLVHRSVQVYRFANARDVKYVNRMSMVYDYLGDLIMSIAISVPVALLFEMPFVNVEKCLLSNLRIFPYPKQRKVRSENIITKDEPSIMMGEAQATIVTGLPNMTSCGQFLGLLYQEKSFHNTLNE